MKLLEYLNQNYNGKWTDKELVANFLDVFGVNVKVTKPLYLFSYNTILVKWNDITKSCRGTILAYVNDKWIIVSRPWDKFYNHHEGHSGVYQEKLFNDYVAENTCYLMQKADGTAIQLYWNPFVNQWDTSTLGTIDTANCYDYPFTFAELFWKIVDKYEFRVAFEMLSIVHDTKEYTWLFELCSKYNRIVTKYPKDTVFIIGARHNQTGEYIPYSDIKTCAGLLGCDLPMVVPLNVKLQNLNVVLDFVEAEAVSTDYGMFPEGFVLYNNGTPVCKLKNSNYIAVHHLGGGDKGHARNCVISAFFAGNIDDIYAVLGDDMQEFVEKMRVWYLEKVHKINKVIADVSSKSFADKREYALYLQRLTYLDKSLISLFYKNMDSIVKGEFGGDDINKWFMDNTRIFEKTIKAL